MNSKAESLGSAMYRIIKLQAQMTDRILQLAAEVEKLLEFTTEREAREFLRARCNLPSSELSTYVRFAKTLKGSDQILRKGRASFPVVKALVASESDARDEILERMEAGARIDNREIASIRKRLKIAKLTPAQIMAQRNGRLARAAARRTGDGAAEQFKSDLFDFVSDVIDIRDAVALGSDVICARAYDLKDTFEAFFGAEHRNLEALKAGSAAYELSCAHAALEHLSEGTLPWAAGVGEIEPGKLHPWLLSLYALTGRAPAERPKERARVRELPTARNRPTVVELFAGAGGMAIGLENAGYDHVALVEFDKHAAATLRRNRPKWNVIQADVRSIDFSLYQQLDIDVVTGGPPCQPYSIEGNALGKDDPRDMLPECVRVVSEIRPKAFVFENVLGLLHAKHADHVADLLRGFRNAGYVTEILRIQAADYGIAQTRSRVLVVGMRMDHAGAFRMPPRFPERRANIGDVLVDLMEANGWSGAREWARERREHPVTDRTGEIVAYGAQASTVVTSRGKRRRNDAAAQRASGFDSTGLPEFAPSEIEASKEGFLPSLTLRMRARLQDFPDDWEFCGGIQAAARQIGNAVPPRMGAAIGLALAAALKDIKWDWEAVLWPEANSRLKMAAPPMDPARLVPAGDLEPAD
jgi:DNA (cytosine-5)-methyltransferase 1